MKNYLFLIILTILTINLVAQDITVSFKTSDAGAVIDSVQATNLATNAAVSLNGNETLTLINLTNGISSMQNMKGSIFPNPCNGSATLQFSTSVDDDATIQIVNSSGQLVMEKKQSLSAGAHSFVVKFPSPGIYIVLARTSNQVLSFKEVSNMAGIQEASLSYLGGSQRSLETTTLKSTTAGKTLNYSTGNNIMYTLFSGKNKRVIVEQPSKSQTIDVAFYACADRDGRNYKTVTIGTQTWMAENLAYLPSITPIETYSDTVSCYYVYDYKGTSISDAKATANYATYGALYNWPAALAVCPEGWHLPSDTEWTTLSDYLTNNGYGFEGRADYITKSLASSSGWSSSSTTGTPGNDSGSNNSTGFSGLPGGFYGFGYGFLNASYGGNWWSSNACDEGCAWRHSLCYGDYWLFRFNEGRGSGLSVRCVRD